MLLAHGPSLGLIYVIVAAFWIVNLGLLLPSFLSRQRYWAALWATLVATLFAGWFSWITFQDLGNRPRDGSRADHIGLIFGLIVGALFGILFVTGCAGLIRWSRLPKP